MKYKDDPKAWHHEHYLKNKARIKDANKAWYVVNKQHVAANDKQVRGLLRDAIFDKLGNKCAHCACNDRRCLQIDHVNNDGYLHRKSKGRAHGSTRKYLREILHDVTGAYQILCANCNIIKYWQIKNNRAEE